MAQYVFERSEIKYIMSKDQHDRFSELVSGRMTIDEYGLTKISSVYFDTANYDIIRRSLEKPVYKEKLRARAYGEVTCESKIFLELKKKYEGIVYKRREKLDLSEVETLVKKGVMPEKNSQIMREIEYFFKTYDIQKKTLITCDRIASYGVDNRDLRITYDRNIKVSFETDKLFEEKNSLYVLDADKCLMEIKVLGALPIWLVKALSEVDIKPVSFSKYGTACMKYLNKQ